MPEGRELPIRVSLSLRALRDLLPPEVAGRGSKVGPDEAILRGLRREWSTIESLLDEQARVFARGLARAEPLHRALKRARGGYAPGNLDLVRVLEVEICCAARSEGRWQRRRPEGVSSRPDVAEQAAGGTIGSLPMAIEHGLWYAVAAFRGQLEGTMPMPQSEPRVHDGDSSSRWCPAAFTLAWLLVGGAANLGAQDLTLSVSPNPATVDDVLIYVVEGIASCPDLTGPVIGDGVVEISFRDSCAILPPSPGPFTTYNFLGPLSAGIWEVRLLDLNVAIPPAVVADTVTVTVLDPVHSVSVSPSPATEQDEVIAHIEGVGSNAFVDSFTVEPGLIRLNVFECGICDPPEPAAPFEIDEELGQLEAGDYLVELFFNNQRVAETFLQVVAGDSCLPGDTVLCLNGGRFRVEATWATSAGEDGPARAVEETADTGLFWFFDAGNIELVVKVLDACETEFETFWVFAGGLTDVGVTLTVTDTETDEVVTYENPVGRRFETITDTAAFATCP